jgi:putative sterol carrier protein
MSRSAYSERPDGGSSTFQFRFTDAEPWHIVVDNGSTRAQSGEAPSADLTFETDWQQWIDNSLHGHDPYRAVLRRRLRPRGSLRGLRAFRKLFRPRPTPIV